MGCFLRWLLESEGSALFGMKLPTGFQLIGQTTLKEYEHWLEVFEREREEEKEREDGGERGKIVRRAYARIGVGSHNVFVCLFVDRPM